MKRIKIIGSSLIFSLIASSAFSNENTNLIALCENPQSHYIPEVNISYKTYDLSIKNQQSSLDEQLIDTPVTEFQCFERELRLNQLFSVSSPMVAFCNGNIFHQYSVEEDGSLQQQTELDYGHPQACLIVEGVINDTYINVFGGITSTTNTDEG